MKLIARNTFKVLFLLLLIINLFGMKTATGFFIPPVQSRSIVMDLKDTDGSYRKDYNIVIYDTTYSNQYVGTFFPDSTGKVKYTDYDPETTYKSYKIEYHYSTRVKTRQVSVKIGTTSYIHETLYKYALQGTTYSHSGDAFGNPQVINGAKILIYDKSNGDTLTYVNQLPNNEHIFTFIEYDFLPVKQYLIIGSWAEPYGTNPDGTHVLRTIQQNNLITMDGGTTKHVDLVFYPSLSSGYDITTGSFDTREHDVTEVPSIASFDVITNNGITFYLLTVASLTGVHIYEGTAGYHQVIAGFKVLSMYYAEYDDNDNYYDPHGVLERIDVNAQVVDYDPNNKNTHRFEWEENKDDIIENYAYPYVFGTKTTGTFIDRTVDFLATINGYLSPILMITSYELPAALSLILDLADLLSEQKYTYVVDSQDNNGVAKFSWYRDFSTGRDDVKYSYTYTNINGEQVHKKIRFGFALNYGFWHTYMNPNYDLTETIVFNSSFGYFNSDAPSNYATIDTSGVSFILYHL